VVWPAVKRMMTVPQFAEYIRTFNFSPWRPSGMVLHNTGAPSLAQRPQGFTQQHLDNLEGYFKNDQGWPSGPHLFIDDNEPAISVFSHLNRPGTHSPSWNGTHLGVELLGDYSYEDDDTGRGAAVVNNAVAAFAILHARLGLDPDRIKFHKEDPRTTHDCPGKDLFADKAEFIQSVKEYMGSGGDWVGIVEPPAPRTGITNTPGDTLNVRPWPSTGRPPIAALAHRTTITILGEAMNGTTKWLRMTHQNIKGWVSAAYVKEST